MTDTHATKERADGSLVQNISDHTVAFGLVEAPSATTSDNTASILSTKAEEEFITSDNSFPRHENVTLDHTRTCPRCCSKLRLSAISGAATLS